MGVAVDCTGTTGTPVVGGSVVLAGAVVGGWVAALVAWVVGPVFATTEGVPRPLWAVLLWFSRKNATTAIATLKSRTTATLIPSVLPRVRREGAARIVGVGVSGDGSVMGTSAIKP